VLGHFNGFVIEVITRWSLLLALFLKRLLRLKLLLLPLWLSVILLISALDIGWLLIMIDRRLRVRTNRWILIKVDGRMSDLYPPALLLDYPTIIYTLVVPVVRYLLLVTKMSPLSLQICILSLLLGRLFLLNWRRLLLILLRK
jgi:hypothetical protein